MSHPYTNAKDVLPSVVFEVVQQHFTGLMYVPGKKDFYKERRKLVESLIEKGASVPEIAGLAGLTKRRVYQIMREVKK